mgnify:CR=1 FL=1
MQPVSHMCHENNPSTLHNIDCKTSARGLLILAHHVLAGLLHGDNRLIKSHDMGTIAEHGHAHGVDGGIGSHGIAFNAGNLHQTTHRIAGQSFSTWLGLPPITMARPAAAIEQATPTSP